MPSAPHSLQPALQLLATLYGATRVQKDLAFFLAAGVLNRDDAYALRSSVHAIFQVSTDTV